MQIAGARMSRVRWSICVVLFFGTTINYLDRQVLGILKPVIGTDLGWSEQSYAFVVACFQVAYTAGLLVAGRLIDRFGVRLAMIVSVAIWSVAGIAHALATTALMFGIARFALGIGESVHFPAGIRAVAEWFPRRERAFAIGLFNIGPSVGSMAAPLLIPLLVAVIGWRGAFAVTGALGFVFLAVWTSFYTSPAGNTRVSASELAHIESDAGSAPDASPPVTIGWLLRRRQLWAIVLGRLITDPVWAFVVFWLPDYLHKRYGLGLDNLGPPLFAIYLLVACGSLFGGWLSSRLLDKGWSLNAARKSTLLLCALTVSSAYLLSDVGLLATVLIIGLIGAAHQGWSVNLYAIVTDLFPQNAVATAISLCSAAAGVGSLVMVWFVGAALKQSNGYAMIFTAVGSAYLLALLVIQILLPRIAPADPLAR